MLISIEAYHYLIQLPKFLIMSSCMKLCNDQLMAIDMQWAYNEDNHSTTFCSTVYLQTLQYYRNCGSNVLGCLLDASETFDRVHYGKLFNILLSKELHICIIRMLLDCYIRQE